MNKSTKKSAVRRLKIIEGQIRGLQRLVENDEYCIDLINQSLAVKQALSGFEDLMLQNHLETHVVEQMKSGQSKKATEEILKVYKISKKK